jgi:hypothetical protein
MRDLPRCAALAAWGSAVLAGLASIDDAVSAVQGADLPHTVDLSNLPLEAPVDGLVGLFAALRRAEVRRLRMVLPVEGDLAGLPGPPHFNQAALDVGECVVSDDGLPCGFVPVIVRHGRDVPDDELEPVDEALDSAVSVLWVGLPTQPGAPGGGLADLSESRRALLTTLQEASSTLEQLQVAAWTRDPVADLDQVRQRSVSADMPPGTPSRAASVLDLAWRVRTVVELAAQNDGGAITTFESERRRLALRRLDVVSRHAVVAAVNAALEPVR